MLKIQFNTSIKQIDNVQKTLQEEIKATTNKIVGIKNQQEYSGLYESLQNQSKLYGKNEQVINKVKRAYGSKDYKTVIEELRNYQTNFEQVVQENKAQRPMNNTQAQPQKPLDLNSINYTSSPVPSPYMNTNTQPNIVRRHFKKVR